MGFKDIIVWLIIFIIGGLIINFIIVPGSFQSFKYNIKNIIPESISDFSITNSGSNKDDYVIVSLGIQCLNFEGTEGYVCKMACDDLEYYKSKCENHEMVCYCKK